MAGRFWSWVFIPGVAFFFLVLCEEGSSCCIAVPGIGLIDARGGGALVTPQTDTVNRKLKENYDDTTISRKTNEATNAEIEDDYPELDPAPSTKSAIKSGPIAHDTSVMPSIPVSTPPDHP